LETDSATSCVVLYPPLRGIIQLTNSATLSELEFHNKSKFRKEIFFVDLEENFLMKHAVDYVPPSADKIIDFTRSK